MGERFMAWSTIYDREGEGTPYMTRIWIGRLRLHIFHRGDADPDAHDHPWDFWTFPFNSYVEEVVEPCATALFDPAQGGRQDGYWQSGPLDQPARPAPLPVTRRVVKAWRWHFRPAEHTHRVLARWNGRHKRVDPHLTSWPDQVMYDSYDAKGDPEPVVGRGFFPDTEPGRIVTLVWRGGNRRRWGFLRHRDGRWCWTHWKEYVYGGGKEAPCGEPVHG